jgi:replication factor C subunit 3/5
MVALDIPAGGIKGNLPWVEKYRPQTLDDLVSHKEIIRTSKFPFLNFLSKMLIIFS